MIKNIHCVSNMSDLSIHHLKAKLANLADQIAMYGITWQYSKYIKHPGQSEDTSRNGTFIDAHIVI